MPSKFDVWARKYKIGPGMNDPSDADVYSGFDGCVGDGWLPILDRLAKDLIKMGWDRNLQQVKEKFGTLRFYTGNLTEQMHQRIIQAENESSITCEYCGKPGRGVSDGWLKTLCKKCEKKRAAEKAARLTPKEKKTDGP